MLLSRKREQIGRDAKFTIHLEITGGILGAVMEGGKREREENKKKRKEGGENEHPRK